MQTRMRKCPRCLVRFNGNVKYCVTCMTRNNPFFDADGLREREFLMRYYKEKKEHMVKQRVRQGDIFIQKENPKCIVKFNEDGSLKE